MANTINLPTHIYKTLIERGNLPSEIPHLQPHDILDEWLKWNGIFGYTEKILEVAQAAYHYKDLELLQPERERLVAKTLQLTAQALQDAVAANGGTMPPSFLLNIEPRVVVEHLAQLESDARLWREHCRSLGEERPKHIRLGDES